MRAGACWRKSGERFGKRWSKVVHAMKMLEKLGIYYYDPRPGNICFGDEDEWEL